MEGYKKYVKTRTVKDVEMVLTDDRTIEILKNIVKDTVEEWLEGNGKIQNIELESIVIKSNITVSNIQYSSETQYPQQIEVKIKGRRNEDVQPL